MGLLAIYYLYYQPYKPFIVLLVGFLFARIVIWLLTKPDQTRIENESSILIGYPVAFIVSLIALINNAFLFANPFNLAGKTPFPPGLFYRWGTTISFVFVIHLLWLIGAMDDRKHLSGKIKLIAFAAVILLAKAPWLIGSPAPVESVLLFVAVYLVFTSLLLIDGINGLFLGYCGASLAYNFFAFDYPAGLWILVLVPNAAIFAGVAFGLLSGNFPTARIRLGEGGVAVFAYLVSSSGIQAVTQGQLIINGDHPEMRTIRYAFQWGGLLPLLFPVFDLLLVLIQRTLNGRSLFAGGHDHLHHRLMQSSYSAKKTTLTILGATFLPCFMFLLLHSPLIAHTITSALTILFVVLSCGPLAYLFWRGYTKVNPYKSGAVNERGRP